MKKIVLILLVAFGVASFSFGDEKAYYNCMANSQYSNCLDKNCKPLYAMGNSEKAKDLQSHCEKVCKDEYHKQSDGICKRYK